MTSSSHTQGPTLGRAPAVTGDVTGSSDVAAADRRGNDAVLLMELADVYRLQGRIDDARHALDRARARPGPYGGLSLDLIDSRLEELGAAPSAHVVTDTVSES